jgi:endonuclease G
MFNRTGFEEAFLGDDHTLSLPVPGPILESDILITDSFNDGVIPYYHYSLSMSKSTRQAIYSAANVNNDKYISLESGKGRAWFIDKRINKQDQIPNYPYQFSRWDRGHLTRRSAVAWGESRNEALKASNDSCAYTNAVLQHEYFNEDEWRVVEELVSKFKLATKLNVLTGPIFTRCDRYYTRDFGDYAVRIPAGFWKIISYVDKNDKLQTQAYIFIQDDEMIKSRKGRQALKLKNFQVTTTEVACWSGLYFDEKLYESNPLNFYNGPERISVKKHKELMKGSGLVALETSIIDSESVNLAREKLSLDSFYQLVKDISWV